MYICAAVCSANNDVAPIADNGRNEKRAVDRILPFGRSSRCISAFGVKFFEKYTSLARRIVVTVDRSHSAKRPFPPEDYRVVPWWLRRFVSVVGQSASVPHGVAHALGSRRLNGISEIRERFRVESKIHRRRPNNA